MSIFSNLLAPLPGPNAVLYSTRLDRGAGTCSHCAQCPRATGIRRDASAVSNQDSDKKEAYLRPRRHLPSWKRLLFEYAVMAVVYVVAFFSTGNVLIAFAATLVALFVLRAIRPKIDA